MMYQNMPGPMSIAPPSGMQN